MNILGNTTAIQRLLESGANKYAVDRDYLNALHCAANHGYTESVQLLLKQCNRKMLEGRDKNGDTPLFYASTYGHYECVSLLLGHNADPNHVVGLLRLHTGICVLRTNVFEPLNIVLRPRVK